MKKLFITLPILLISIGAMAQNKPVEAKKPIIIAQSGIPAKIEQAQPQKQQVAIIPIETWQAIYSTFTGSYGQAKQDILHSTQLTADQKVSQQIAIDAYVDKIMGAVIIDSVTVNGVKGVKK
jgi:hypothetical protein